MTDWQPNQALHPTAVAVTGDPPRVSLNPLGCDPFYPIMSNTAKVIKVEPVVLNISPYGFYRYASEFARWASRARAEKSSDFSPVPYYLYCRSIELVLKAYLLTKGISKNELKARNLGHNLSALLAKAKVQGLTDIVSLKREWEIELVKANNCYSKKGFEYFKVVDAARGYRDLPTLNDLHHLTEQLLQSLKQVCLNAT